MKDLAGWLLQWTFSGVGIAHLVAVALLVIAAVRLSPGRRVKAFLLVATCLWLATTTLGFLEPYRPRAQAAWALWTLSLAIIYAAVLGTLVVKGKGVRPIVVSSAVLFLVLTPLSWLSAIYFACYIGHDCP
jgi:hypothetical protein